MTFVKDHKKTIAACACVLMLFSVVVITAQAYWNVYVNTEGDWSLRTSCDVRLVEHVDGFTKYVAVAANDESCNSFVRVRAYCPDEYGLVFESSDTGSFVEDGTVTVGEWVTGDDGWYYFQGILEPGYVTSDLVVSVRNQDGSDIHEVFDEQDFNVVVIYEAVPVMDDAWSRKGYDAESYWQYESQ